MKKFSRGFGGGHGGKKFGGNGKKFGGGFGGGFKPRFGGRDGGHATMHEAICNACGRECEVPFRPTGSRPVLCKNCFRKDGDHEPKRFGGDRFEKKPAFREERASASSGSFNADRIEDRLKSIEQKIDALTRLLAQMEE